MRRTVTARILGACLVVWKLSPLASAEEPLVTDRPDFTESSSTVGAGISWRLGR